MDEYEPDERDSESPDVKSEPESGTVLLSEFLNFIFTKCTQDIHYSLQFIGLKIEYLGDGAEMICSSEDDTPRGKKY